MKNECEKFEGLFIFADDETFNEHIMACDVCRKKYEKMKKISSLLQEVKPQFKKKIVVHKSVMTACVMFLILLCGVSFNVLDQKYSIVDTIKYGQAVSIEDMGFPVDSYGLLMVE